MSLIEVRTDAAPAPVGPYSQAIDAGGVVFCSGQIPLDPKTGTMIGRTAEEQTEKIMDNVQAVLEKAGLGVENIAKTTIFLTDMKSFSAVNAVYERKLDGHRPARSTVEVSALPKGALVEIEVVAVRS